MENKQMTKTHINDTSSMYRVTDMLNHKGFIHWNKNKSSIEIIICDV